MDQVVPWNSKITQKINESESGNAVEPKRKEQILRAWIANKESICPYAPGLARFIQLPEKIELNSYSVAYFAEELGAFYDDRQRGKRVGRWMLMPHSEWRTHEEAHTYSETIFWLLNAAYFQLVRDSKSVNLALSKRLDGYTRGYKGEILNPIIGHHPSRSSNVVPAKSLFYSALSPLYRSKQFYRYSPYCVIPLVYASEFQQLKDKHKSVTESVAFEMAYVGLYELFGDDLKIDLSALEKELPIWGSIIDRIAALMRAAQYGIPSHASEAKGCPASNLNYFRECEAEWVDMFVRKYKTHLVQLSILLMQTNATAKQIICACFAGSGLYTIPDYQH